MTRLNNLVIIRKRLYDRQKAVAVAVAVAVVQVLVSLYC
jgi:heme/copper-type cytochrome/quinol oxidase subunit 4